MTKMDKDQAKRIIEALLFVSDKPVSAVVLKEVLKDIETTDIRTLAEELNNEYASSGRSFSIRQIAGGFQMLTDPVYSRWISTLYKKPADKLTGPSLETLAIIAYKQPLTRGEIEAIRGVNVDGVLATLEARDLIRSRGRLDAPGRPILYGTTNEFLQHFGLKSIEELPKLKEFQESDLDFVKEKEKSQVIDTETGRLEPRETKTQEPIPIVESEPQEPTEEDDALKARRR
ncbi:MAG: SMC-Scp complex subunit ScpB [Candidatus Omnitrophica bacterium]|nr:SMC-Scp complex subunit ScpB [Candidatus Omnitrophota bacterium]